MTTLRGIFFDLDDTLIDYAEAERSALLAGCALAARRRPAIDADTLATAIYDAYTRRYAYGTPGYADLATLSVDEFRRLLTEDALRSFGIDDPALVHDLIAAYTDAEAEALATFPDAETTLKKLRPHFHLGLITNGPSAMQRAKLAALALDGYFDVVIVDSEFGHPKPDPRIFQHAARLVRLTPGELLFVGNSLAHDIAGARAAGWISVWLNPASVAPTGDNRPDYTIGCLRDLCELAPVAKALPSTEALPSTKE